MRNARSGMPGNGIVPRLPAGADRGREGSGTALETDESSRDTAVVTDLFRFLVFWLAHRLRSRRSLRILSGRR